MVGRRGHLELPAHRTAAELEELSQRIFALMRPYRVAARTANAPEDARQIFVTLRMLPLIGDESGTD